MSSYPLSPLRKAASPDDFPNGALRDGNAFPLEDIVPQTPFSKPHLFAVVYDHLFLFLFYMIRMSSFRCMRKSLRSFLFASSFARYTVLGEQESLLAVALMFPLVSFRVLKIIFLANISVVSFLSSKYD